MRVRPYASVDLDALIALFQSSVRIVARRDYTLEQVFAWAPDAIDRERWAVRLAASSTWVAALGQRPAGFITLEPEGHLDMLYVDPHFQSRGVASRLLRRLETSAEARGLARLFTEASITARLFFRASRISNGRGADRDPARARARQLSNGKAPRLTPVPATERNLELSCRQILSG